MAFEQLEFTRDWTVSGSAEEGGFPTYEPDEATVRADMQCLFNEIRDFINGKMVEPLNSKSGAEHILTSSGKSIEAVLAELLDTIEGLQGSSGGSFVGGAVYVFDDGDGNVTLGGIQEG